MPETPAEEIRRAASLEQEAVTPASSVLCLWPPHRRAEAGRIATMAIVCLHRGRIATVGELTSQTAQDITDIANAGGAVVGEIRRVLAACGLSLKGDAEAVETQARVLVLTRAGVRKPEAFRFARQSWPTGEIAPGVTLTVAGGESRG